MTYYTIGLIFMTVTINPTHAASPKDNTSVTIRCKEALEPEAITAKDVIELLNLSPLPEEGGYYLETYRSKLTVAVDPNNEQYNAGTAIYYMVTPESFSALHRLKYDEIFHYYAGSPVEMLLIYPDGRNQLVTIGNDLRKGHRPQVVVPAGVWQGTRIATGGAWSLLGTTMSPSFEFKDFELGERCQLIELAPAIEDLIRRYTR